MGQQQHLVWLSIAAYEVFKEDLLFFIQWIRNIYLQKEINSSVYIQKLTGGNSDIDYIIFSCPFLQKNFY
jgi:hypothetical protein